MLKLEKYDEETGIQECWYDSSNILYSKCNDKEALLEIVFKPKKSDATTASRYVYKDMDMFKYLQFRNGITTTLSNGKAFHEFIRKGGFEYERLEDIELSVLEERYQEILKEKQVLNEDIVSDEEANNVTN